MNEVKFSCPKCEQHIECDKSYAGHKISCPDCKAEIRIPLSGSFAEGTVPKAELVLAPPGSTKALAPNPAPKPAETIAAPSVPKVEAPIAAPSVPKVEAPPVEISIPKPTAPVVPPPRSASEPGPVLPEPLARFAIPSAVGPKPVDPAPPKIPADAHEANCICPVCKSELRLPVEAAVKSQGTPLVAELVPKAPKPVVAPPTPATPASATQVPATLTAATPAAAAPAAATPAGATPAAAVPAAATPTAATPVAATPSLPKVESEAQLDEIPPDEREQQLAEARKAHPVATYPTMKPRLNYILTGEAPIPKDTLHPSAVRLKKEEPKKEEPKPPPPPIKTMTE